MLVNISSNNMLNGLFAKFTIFAHQLQRTIYEEVYLLKSRSIEINTTNNKFN